MAAPEFSRSAAIVNKGRRIWMKKTGKWLCAILAFCMILGIFSESVIAANASPFEDVLPKDWFYSDVQDVC